MDSHMTQKPTKRASAVPALVRAPMPTISRACARCPRSRPCPHRRPQSAARAALPPCIADRLLTDPHERGAGDDADAEADGSGAANDDGDEGSAAEGDDGGAAAGAADAAAGGGGGPGESPALPRVLRHAWMSSRMAHKAVVAKL
eukprot:365648-Chlamydomonas_euryale.AAC.1